MRVGFIGVGNMGGPMCRNLIRNSNHEVTVFDLNPAAMRACAEVGAREGASTAEVAANSDVVFTSLPMPAHVESVVLGPDGIAYCLIQECCREHVGCLIAMFPLHHLIRQLRGHT